MTDKTTRTTPAWKTGAADHNQTAATQNALARTIAAAAKQPQISTTSKADLRDPSSSSSLTYASVPTTSRMSQANRKKAIQQTPSQSNSQGPSSSTTSATSSSDESLGSDKTVTPKAKPELSTEQQRQEELQARLKESEKTLEELEKELSELDTQELEILKIMSATLGADTIAQQQGKPRLLTNEDRERIEAAIIEGTTPIELSEGTTTTLKPLEVNTTTVDYFTASLQYVVNLPTRIIGQQKLLTALETQQQDTQTEKSIAQCKKEIEQLGRLVELVQCKCIQSENGKTLNEVSQTLSDSKTSLKHCIEIVKEVFSKNKGLINLLADALSDPSLTLPTNVQLFVAFHKPQTGKAENIFQQQDKFNQAFSSLTKNLTAHRKNLEALLEQKTDLTFNVTPGLKDFGKSTKDKFYDALLQPNNEKFDALRKNINKATQNPTKSMHAIIACVEEFKGLDPSQFKNDQSISTFVDYIVARTDLEPITKHCLLAMIAIDQLHQRALSRLLLPAAEYNSQVTQLEVAKRMADNRAEQLPQPIMHEARMDEISSDDEDDDVSSHSSDSEAAAQHSDTASSSKSSTGSYMPIRGLFDSITNLPAASPRTLSRANSQTALSTNDASSRSSWSSANPSSYPALAAKQEAAEILAELRALDGDDAPTKEAVGIDHDGARHDLPVAALRTQRASSPSISFPPPPPSLLGTAEAVLTEFKAKSILPRPTASTITSAFQSAQTTGNFRDISSSIVAKSFGQGAKGQFLEWGNVIITRGDGNGGKRPAFYSASQLSDGQAIYAKINISDQNGWRELQEGIFKWDSYKGICVLTEGRRTIIAHNQIQLIETGLFRLNGDDILLVEGVTEHSDDTKEDGYWMKGIGSDIIRTNAEGTSYTQQFYPEQGDVSNGIIATDPKHGTYENGVYTSPQGHRLDLRTKTLTPNKQQQSLHVNDWYYNNEYDPKDGLLKSRINDAPPHGNGRWRRLPDGNWQHEDGRWYNSSTGEVVKPAKRRAAISEIEARALKPEELQLQLQLQRQARAAALAVQKQQRQANELAKAPTAPQSQQRTVTADSTRSLLQHIADGLARVGQGFLNLFSRNQQPLRHRLQSLPTSSTSTNEPVYQEVNDASGRAPALPPRGEPLIPKTTNRNAITMGDATYSTVIKATTNPVPPQLGDRTSSTYSNTSTLSAPGRAYQQKQRHARQFVQNI